MNKTMRALQEAGFERCAEYLPIKGTRWLDLEGQELIPRMHGIYLMIEDGRTVRYIGKSFKYQGGMRGRAYSYRRPMRRPIAKHLRDALKRGHRITVWCLVPHRTQTRYRGLPCSMVCGLETGLIRWLQPAWNIG